MDRLLVVEPKELVLQFEVGERSQVSIRLKNVMHTMSVAYMVHAIPQTKYIIKPLSGIIPSLGVVSVQITLCPQSELPDSAPRSGDRLLVDSVVVMGGSNNAPVTPEWFTAQKKQVYSDRSMHIFFVGRGILGRLLDIGSMEGIREVLELDEVLVNLQDHQGCTPLHNAVAIGRSELVQLLLEFKPNLEIKNALGETALHEAVRQHNVLAVELLLARGADVNSRNACGFTPLHIAITQQHFDMVHLLNENGCNLDAVMDDGRTALHDAIENRRHNCIEALLEKGARPDVRIRETGETPLHIAVTKGDDTAVELLLKYGARRDVCNRKGESPRDVAAALKREQQLSVLKELALEDELRKAARRGRMKDVQAILSKGAPINGRDDHGWTALHCAAFKGHVDIVCLLVGNGANMRSKDDMGYTPLHCAIESGQKDVVRLLGKHGVPLDGCTSGSSASDLVNYCKYLENTEMQLDTKDDDGLVDGHAGIWGNFNLKTENPLKGLRNLTSKYAFEELPSPVKPSIAVKLQVPSYIDTSMML